MNPIQSRLSSCKMCRNSFESHFVSIELGGSTLSLGQSLCDPCQVKKESQIRAQTRGFDPTVIEWKDVYWDAYKDFDMNLLPAASRDIAQKVLNWQQGPKGIGLVGESRHGKTFIMHELSRRIFKSGRKIKIIGGTEFAYACGSPEQSERRNMIDSCVSAPFLFMDDISMMRITDRVESDFYHVIEQRRRHLRPFFTTLNANGEEFKAMMSANGGNPIVNRLRHDVCEFYSI